MFEDLDRFLDYKFTPTQTDMLTSGADEVEIERARKVLYLQHANLMTSEFLLSYENRGIAFTRPLESDADQRNLAASGISTEATRTFRLQPNAASTGREPRPINGLLMYAGTLLLLIGVAGFLIRVFRFLAEYLLHRRSF